MGRYRIEDLWRYDPEEETVVTQDEETGRVVVTRQPRENREPAPAPQREPFPTVDSTPLPGEDPAPVGPTVDDSIGADAFSQLTSTIGPRVEDSVFLPIDPVLEPITPPQPSFGGPVIVPETTYYDHAFELPLFLTRDRKNETIAPPGSSFVEIRTFYNFYIERYEQVIQNSELDERLLPSLYVLASELELGATDEQNTIFRKHLTLNNAISSTFIDVINEAGEKTGEIDRGQFFDIYAKKVSQLDLSQGSSQFGQLISLRNSFVTLGVPISNVDFLDKYNPKARLFPMFVDIRFNTDSSTQFAEILSASNLSTILMKDVIDENFPATSASFQISAFDISQQNQATTRGNTQAEVQLWDLEEWIMSLTPEAFRPLQNGTFLGKYNDEIKQLQDPSFDLAKQLNILIFKGKFKKMVEREFRTYQEVLEGDDAYNESVFYEIQKIDVATDEVLQRFFLPNSNTIDELRFVDTQVKYDKRYRYEIYVYQMIVGNRYSYNLRSLRADEADVSVRNRPSVQLARIPVYEFEGRVMDLPPVFPELTVIPFKGVNNRVKFNLNSNVGVYRMMPQTIDSQDEQLFQRLREAQQVAQGNPLTFRTDDRVAIFEVYRLEQRPTSWSDFTGNRIADIVTDIDSVSLQKASAGSFVDMVFPNTKYYYVFRSIDVHGHVSNPTPIYEVELVEQDGTVFSSIRIVDFDDGSSQRTTTKPATRFVQIRPAFAQTLLNEQKSGLVKDGERIDSIVGKRNFHLGVQDESVWDKAFKIRFVSRKTGRRIDFNVQFKQSELDRVDNDGKIVKSEPRE